MLKKLRHRIWMGSLNKVSFDQAKKWTEEVENYVTQWKLDGISVEVIYDEGKFWKAITKGDTQIGLDITNSIRHAVPQTISEKKRLVSVRGEAIIKKRDFKKFFETFSNPRALVSGLTHRKSEDDPDWEYIHFIAYQTDKLFDTEISKLQWLKNEGFEVVPYVLRIFEKTYQILNKQRNTLDILIDGLVLKANRIEDQHGFFFWRFAVKFNSEKSETVVEDIQWNVGTTGRLNPVVIVKPIELGGTTIRRASGHSRSFMKNNGVQIGSKVIISRAGDVIPYIEEVTENPGFQELTEHLECKEIFIKGTHYFCVRKERKFLRKEEPMERKEARKRKALEIGQRAIEKNAWTLNTAVEFCQQIEKGRLSDEVLDFFYNATRNKENQKKVRPTKGEGKDDGKTNPKASGNSSESSR